MDERKRANGSRVTRRVVLSGASAAAVAIALAACGGAAPTPTPTPASAAKSGTNAATPNVTGAGGTVPPAMGSASGTTAPSPGGSTPMPASGMSGGTPKKGGILKMTQPLPIVPFEFHQLTLAPLMFMLGVFDTIVRYDAALKPQPRLAESWAWNATNTELTLRLRKGVKYHTGRDFTSDDVKFNIERVRDMKLASQLRGNSLTIKEITTPDASTAVLKFDQPNLAIFDMLDLMVMLDKETAADLEGAKQVIGTGAFKWKEYAPGSKLTLVRNDQYWETGKPYLDGIDLQITDDKQSMVTGVESGQRGVGWQVLAQDLNRLKGNPNVTPIISDKGAQFYYLGANATGDVVKDKRIRQAVNYAIDRKRIADTLLFGLAEPTALPWPKFSPAANAEIDKSVSFDLERSKKLFADAGFAPGSSLTIEVGTQDPLNQKIAQVVQSDLAKINIKMDVQPYDTTTFQKKLNEAGFMQVFGNTIGFSNLSPVTFFLTAYPVRVSGNAAKFQSPDYSDLVTKMQVETDPAKLKLLYDRMNKLIVDESFNMIVCTAPQGWVTYKAVKNWTYNTFNMVQLESVWLDR